MKLFGFVSSALVALVASGYAAPTVEAVDSGDVLIASVTAGSEVLRLGDIAAANSIAVAYQQGNHSYLRWSTDGGTTFAAPWALRSGLRAKDPRVAACDNTIWAVSIWRSDNASNVGVDHVDVTAPDSTASRYSLGSGYSADIACTADAVGVAWLRDGHAQLDIFDVACQTSCAPSYSTDLGVADSAFIAPTDDGFVVSAERRVQPFGVEETAGGLVVTPGPLTLISGPNASPVIAVDGARVVIAYSHSWDNAIGSQTHMRISDDSGSTFGPRIVVDSHCKGCEGGSGPNSVDVRSGVILVDVSEGSGVPSNIDQLGFYTRNDGSRWHKTVAHYGGYQMGVITDAGMAEAWDSHYYVGWPYGKYPQEIGFHITPLN